MAVVVLVSNGDFVNGRGDGVSFKTRVVLAFVIPVVSGGNMLQPRIRAVAGVVLVLGVVTDGDGGGAGV